METHINYENKLVDQHGFEQAIHIPESQNYAWHLDNLYLVKKKWTRWVAAAGAARISMVLECCKEHIEDAKDYATTVGRIQSNTYRQRNNKEYKDTTFNDINEH